MALGPELQMQGEATQATKNLAAATLAAAIITAAGRPHSVDEALKVHRDVYFSLFPSPSAGVYQAWKKGFTGNERHT